MYLVEQQIADVCSKMIILDDWASDLSSPVIIYFGFFYADHQITMK